MRCLERLGEGLERLGKGLERSTGVLGQAWIEFWTMSSQSLGVKNRGLRLEFLKFKEAADVLQLHGGG